MADRSVLRTSDTLSLPISIVVNAQQYRVTVAEPANRAMLVKFTGQGRGIDALLQEVASPAGLKWEYRLSPEEAEKAAAQGTYALPVRDGILPLIRDYRVTLDESSVSQVVITVEKLLRRPEKVKVRLSEELRSVLQCDFEPPEVTVIGTRKDLAAFQGDAVAQINKAKPLTEGQFDEQLVDLKAANDVPVTFDPPTVMVKNLQLPTEVLVPKRVDGPIPITIEAPPELLKKYYVDIDAPTSPATLPGLEVLAPRELDVRAADVHAVLRLPGEESPNTLKSRALTITFRDRRVRIREGSEPQEVTFMLRSRDGAAASN
jgi:hypothetical protein